MSRQIDPRCKQVFKDLLSHRNRHHWDPMDLKNFLAARGDIVSEHITHTQSGIHKTIAARLASEKFKNIERIIACVYSHTDMTIKDYGGIMECVCASAGEKEMLAGWIPDEQADINSVTVHLIALCSGAASANSALFFYDFLSQYYARVKNFIVKGCYTYKSIDVNRDIFLELENNKLKVGYRGINGIEKKLSAVLNHSQFEGFFSRLVVDTAQDKIYKYYLLNHDVTDDIKNTIEAVYIHNMLSILEHGYKECCAVCSE